MAIWLWQRGRPGNRVSKTLFQIRGFSKLMPHSKYSHSPFLLHRPVSRSHSHTLAPLSLTHFSHSVYFKFITFAERFDKATTRCTKIVSNAHHRVLSSFSLHDLWKKKKGESLYAKCEDSIFTIWLLRNSENNQRNFGFICFFFFFFLFWFMYWISNRTVKKDRRFIVFWD